jgi:hypothetical protein
LSRGEERFLFRVWADVSRDTPRSYGTPFFREKVEGLAAPSWLLADLDDAEPYVVGGDGSSLGWDDSRLLTLNQGILEALTRRRARRTLRLMEVTSPEIVLHVFRHPDRAHHTYWRFFEPESFPSPLRPSPDRVRRFSDAIPAAYENVDRLLGELLDRTGPETLVAVVSDHGAQGGIHAPYGHHEEGIYILSGPRVTASSAVGPVLRQEDLLPVLMAHLGLPVAKDLEGNVPSALLPRGRSGETEPLATVDTYGPRAVSSEERRLDEDLQERLRSLGYLDG